MKVKIKTLTPIHIGTGKRIGPLELFNNYRIDYDKLFELIAEEKQEEFIQWIDQNSQIGVQGIKNKFGINQHDIINKCGLYSFSGSFQKDSMNEGIKDSSYKLYIPGSSLKGSLRTALMYKVLSLPSHHQLLSNHLDYLINQANKLRGNSSKIKDLLKNSDKKLEEEVFNCGALKKINEQLKTVYDDQKYDLLKLVKISDSTSVSTYENGEITELQVYALKKIEPHKKFKTYAESIKNNVELEFDISIDIEFLKRVKKELNDPNSDFGKQYFIGIEKKLRDLFDIDIKNDSELSEEKIVETLIKAWNYYGEAVSNHEKKWVESIKNKGNANVNALNKLYSISNKFKVGFGTGFSGMTILPLLLSDNTFKQKADEFYKAVGIGFHRSTNTPLIINEFPYTRKYSNNQTIYGGFGWVQILNGNKAEKISDISQEENKEIKIERPAHSVIAEIIDDKSKPPKVKIIEGEHSGKETILPGIRLEGLGLIKGSKIYVKLIVVNKNLQKAELKGKVE
ncbi:MAG: type III-A CRISPR-associated RAMP protein Csm5 [Candidatus Aenigmatarchaeota archaeon]